MISFLCPRRLELDQATVDRLPDQDTWSLRGRNIVCSCCGSLSPQELFTAIFAGLELIPSGQDDKVYVRVANGPQAKFLFRHFSENEKARFVALMHSHEINLGHSGHFQVTPFFACRPTA